MKFDRLKLGVASATAGRVTLVLGIAAAGAGSCAVDGEAYDFDDAQGGASASSTSGSGGSAPASGGAVSSMSTGGAVSGGRNGVPGPNTSGGAAPSASGGTSATSTGGKSAAASGGNSASTTGGTPPIQTGGAPAAGSTATSSGGTSGSGGAPSNQVNECAAADNPCLNGAQCQDTDSGFTCTCLARYTGERCEHLKFRGMGLVTGATASAVRELSDDGTVAAGSATVASGSTVPVRLNLTNSAPLQSLGIPPETSGCTVTASNENGTWLGGSCLGLKSGGGFMWTPNDGPSLAAVSVYRSVDFRDATADARVRIGSIVIQEGDDQQPFRWTTSTGFVPIEMPEAGNHYAYNLSANGEVMIGNFVGVVDNRTSARGFRWTTSSAASYLPVSAAFANTYLVNGMSEDGAVMVGYGVTDQVPHALRWSGSPIVMEDLGSGFLMDCNGDGKVLLGGNAAEEIVVWETGVPRTLLSILGDTPDLAGWTLVEPIAISDDGKVVVGNGTHDGVTEGWIAHL